MDYSLIKSISALVSGGFLIYLAITVLRDNAVNRLNRLAAGLLFFAGLGPLFISFMGIVFPNPVDLLLDLSC